MWTYAVANDSHETFPAGFGHHPYFLRSVAGSPDARLAVQCETAFALTGGMPDAAPGPLRPAADFRQARELGHEAVDDCLAGGTGEQAATIEWPGAVRLDITADPLLAHAVLYIPTDRDYFALEPVSNANDAFTLDAHGIGANGLFLLQPGETRSASFTMRAADLVTARRR
ncbi:hypothetical protein [Demequina litorisediminis]|uniref:Aldose 1-epimerase n=1 Tax=Demequina litorisediminis TaxID=1849022 RepID=A0ABQ6IDQ7_9MICO|nr:hypothetical protein [Demequina litorisediminis]GMA35870.1 hypothetical protein GCM10025876_20740 [Demequina litorisediminis]